MGTGGTTGGFGIFLLNHQAKRTDRQTGKPRLRRLAERPPLESQQSAHHLFSLP
jgi:hypothetical protein